MSARVIDGTALAKQIRAEVAAEVKALAAEGTTPGIAVVLVGADPASEVYVHMKTRASHEAGMFDRLVELPADVSAEELFGTIDGLNADPTIHGILVQLPLPPHLNPKSVLERVHPAKDVDGFHPLNAGLLAKRQPSLVPCTPKGVMHLLREAGVELPGARAVVLGRSQIVGRPMLQLLLDADCTVTAAHTRTRDLPAECRRADILVVAAGRPEMVRGDWVAPGAAVIDVGINRLPDRRLVGDVAFAEAAAHAGAITPVPGGVGPMTIASLLRNTVKAARRRRC